MTVTVTLSPSIDKTAVVCGFDIDKVNRAESIRLDPGGKGINVSLALASLGEKTVAAAFEFEESQIIAESLKRARAGYEAVECGGRIRTNLKIFDSKTQKTIELNEQNPRVGEEKVAELIKRCKKLSASADILVLSGSVPPGVSSDIYYRLAKEAREANPELKVVLDCEGEALKNGFKASPYLIKPNVDELEKTFGATLKSEDDIISICRDIIAEYGVKAVLVSAGKNGAMIITEETAISRPAVEITPKSAQGAGDAMVAGACAAISRGLGAADILEYGLCAAAGAVELEGTAFCQKERFEELLRSLWRTT